MNINTLKIYMLLAMVSNSHAELIHEAYRFDVIDTQIHDDSWCRFQRNKRSLQMIQLHLITRLLRGIHAAYQVRGNENKDLTPKQIEILDPLMNNSVRFAVKPQGIVCGEYAEQEAGIVSLITEQKRHSHIANNIAWHTKHVRRCYRFACIEDIYPCCWGICIRV